MLAPHSATIVMEIQNNLKRTIHPAFLSASSEKNSFVPDFSPTYKRIIGEQSRPFLWSSSRVCQRSLSSRRGPIFRCGRNGQGSTHSFPLEEPRHFSFPSVRCSAEEEGVNMCTPAPGMNRHVYSCYLKGRFPVWPPRFLWRLLPTDNVEDFSPMPVKRARRTKTLLPGLKQEVFLLS